MHRKKRKKKRKEPKKTVQPTFLHFFFFLVLSRFLRYLRLCTTFLYQINSPPGREAIVLVIVPTDNCKAIKVVNDCLLREISENGNCCAPCDVMIATCPVQTNNCNNGRLFRGFVPRPGITGGTAKYEISGRMSLYENEASLYSRLSRTIIVMSHEVYTIRAAHIQCACKICRVGQS
ncbi:CEI_1a_G0023190.mRNA.1.CDS.1 [Saccharomyces cerevisiae]|nr:AMH_1a_G0023270.mRNA.1.CDS.1 [Saccharomyces cerevisiae]CAI4519837.1 CEI_1a_G0023190.mRNA.1.CDS.1 [Saccharomyces cerevisiae]CAI6701088.1 AMH_1a_G0023270.mRNA.1.CDS.1 [Saccharomyces cerevisiae]CAI7325122.1 CEI_1a_G0023190.mRNA.1.CDS.1 [Saccharomyces cerevisiae]